MRHRWRRSSDRPIGDVREDFSLSDGHLVGLGGPRAAADTARLIYTSIHVTQDRVPKDWEQVAQQQTNCGLPGAGLLRAADLAPSDVPCDNRADCRNRRQ